MPTTANRPAAAPAAASAAPWPQGHTEAIEQSHQRCAALGLSRIERPDYSPILNADLQIARERNQRLSVQAAPVMALLAEQIVDTQSMIVLTDALGTILHAVGDSEFSERAGKVALSSGVNWAEQSKGTNAIGTALFEEKATLVHANEHYMHANGFLTCSAAPILDPRGNILGVLDVTGDHRSYHPHTMGLVRMSARMIENHWLADDFKHRLRLHFHSRPEFVGTLMEGIVAVGPDGRLLGANRSALDQLGISGAALRMQTLTSLFGTSVSAVIDHFRSPLATALTLHLADGRAFHVTARYAPGSADMTFALARPGVATLAGPGAVPGTPAVDPAIEGAAAGTRPAARSAALAAPSATVAPKLSGLAYLLTGDAQVRTLVDKIRRVLDRDIPLLILGETGTGKEILARAVHHDSQRARQPFVAVNCASIPETLIEAELFGYEDGAFTGARRKGAVGRILQANGGTLFLDEIGDMPLALQARLLRVLQERQVTPLGATKSIAVDVAVIAATHRNLREMIERQEFREDLYYRLNGLAVRLPALRERNDLQAIVQRMLVAECPNHPPPLSPRVIEYFSAYHWPGNLRQLCNVLRTACVMAAGEPAITEDHLSDDFVEDLRRHAAAHHAAAAAVTASPGPAPAADTPRAAGATGATGIAALADPATALGSTVSTAGPTSPPNPWMVPRSAASTWSEPAGDLARPSAERLEPPMARVAPDAATPPRTLEEIEIDSIRSMLESVGGNISEASKRLGISRNTIYRKLRWNRSA
jgi:sigma-54 dependent transcriptional regulator, acetoin dehydrogenase operon transcriptional activator AcoR